MFDIILTILVVAAALAWAAWRVWRATRGKGGCDHCAAASPTTGNSALVQEACGCDGCPLHENCTDKARPAKKSPLA